MNTAQTPRPPAAIEPPGNGSFTYVVVTPARNEEAYIEGTIQSMIHQTVPPLKWIIVSDGSTDRTDDIASGYVREHSWIELVRTPARATRHFAGKVAAFNAGYRRLQHLPYEFIASLDADITFGEDYFEFLLGKFAQNAKLGLAGTPFREGATSYDYRFVSIEHVSGACQLFRRRCFDDIGGYKSLKSGGVDHVAVLTARMKGWQTRSFTERTSVHHREMGSAQHGPAKKKFATGRLDYVLGGHPLWEIFRAAYQATKPPLVLGGLLIFLGYFSGVIVRAERSVSPELMAFRRREQMHRLRRFLSASRSTRNNDEAPG